MSTILEQPPVEDLTTPHEIPYRFSVDDFYRMVDLDILPAGNRAYLWDGLVYEKPINTMVRSAIVSMLFATLCRALPSGWFYSFDNSITIGPDKAPTPDLAVLRGKPDDYLDRRPEIADAGLLIEMADEIRGDFATSRLAGYASAGIPACWMIDLSDRLIHVHEQPIPSESRYGFSISIRRGVSFPLILDGQEFGLIATSDLLLAR